MEEIKEKKFNGSVEFCWAEVAKLKTHDSLGLLEDA
jgi:hypothetical protein